jgi:hypothetical protein
MQRREFLGSIPAAFAAAQAVPMFGGDDAQAGEGAAQGEGAPLANATADDKLRTFLLPHQLRRETIDRFLDPDARVWAKFDPEFGYLLRNSFMRDGVDGCHTLARYAATGQRLQVNFADQPCRINSYGDSFTQGHQVGDGETWQEILSAHFCEPIRNFGIGGFGVYQAYRRLIKTEATELGAKHILFNIWGDDHLRSVYAWRWLAFPANAIESMSGEMFHANPWVHARLGDRGELIEMPNLCPTPQSLYRLCELDFLIETFRKDEIAQLLFAQRTGEWLDPGVAEKVAAKCDVAVPQTNTAAEVKAAANRLLHDYAIRVGMAVIDRMHAFCNERGKELLVLLSYPVGAVWHACNRSPAGDPDNVDWHPKRFKEHVMGKSIRLVDSLPAHVAEFDTFKLSAKDYVDRYYIGHYTPRGNHFFAYAIKDSLRDWLSPPPPAYRDDGEPLIRFDGYLPG